jgi:hypothetical protein
VQKARVGMIFRRRGQHQWNVIGKDPL